MPELIGIARRGAAPAPLAPSSGELPAPAAIGPESLPAGLSTYRIETWGCQMNEHDSEKLAGLLRSMGLKPAATAAGADIVLLNTCSVRERAAGKVFTRLGQLRRHKAARPGMILAVCGCVAQQEQERIFRRAPYVDIVMGPRRLASLPDLIAESRRKRHALGVFDPRDRLVPEMDSVLRFSRTRAYVTIMEGCNKTCTFCIVPFTRGREACRAPGAILAEVARCVEDGLVEVELLGQNVNAWRHGGDGSGSSWDFARLLDAVAATPGVRRVRFTTSHPLHFRDEIIDVMAAHGTICRHLHLPVQSGSDAVLGRMRRGYTVEEYRQRLARLRRAIPDIALSTDIIVGFPGETAEDFAATLEIVRESRFDTVFSFVYSTRPGTPASGYPDDVTPQTKKQRLHRLQALQDGIRLEKLRALEGRTVEVLVEGPAQRGAGLLRGRTSWNDLVNFEGDPSLVGRFVSVRIERALGHSLRGAVRERAETGLTSTTPQNIDEAVRPA